MLFKPGHRVLLATNALLFQVNNHAAGMEHGVVGCINAYKRAQRGDIRVFKNRPGGGLLQLGHSGIRHRLRCLNTGLQLACVLRREQSFWNEYVQQHCQHQGAQRHQQCQPLALEHPS